jgi:hypothetical protein
MGVIVSKVQVRMRHQVERLYISWSCARTIWLCLQVHVADIEFLIKSLPLLLHRLHPVVDLSPTPPGPSRDLICHLSLPCKLGVCHHHRHFHQVSIYSCNFSLALIPATFFSLQMRVFAPTPIPPPPPHSYQTRVEVLVVVTITTTPQSPLLSRFKSEQRSPVLNDTGHPALFLPLSLLLPFPLPPLPSSGWGH